MKLTEPERGMLRTKMADDVVASIFGKPVSWVRRARAFIEQEAAADLESWNRLGAEPEAPPAPEPDEPHQIDLEEVIAAKADYPDPRMGAPAELCGAGLAAWLYDNTEATFEQIAETTGLDPEDVRRIADGEELAAEGEPWTTVILPPGRDWSDFEPSRPTTTEEFRKEYECEFIGVDMAATQDLAAVVPPPPRKKPPPMIMAPRHIGKSQAAEQAREAARAVGMSVFPPSKEEPKINKGGRPRVHPAPIQIAEIPDHVLRYCRWFLTAKWRVVDVAYLFDLEEQDLRAALHLY